MTTNTDLKIGVNLEIGSVPVSLDVEVSSEDGNTVYTFDGCVQDAVIDIGNFISYVGQQFGVAVQLPPELNLDAVIDYVAGQVIYTSSKSNSVTATDGATATANTSTELGVAAKFDLEYSNGGKTDKVTLTFYADTIIASPAPETGNPYVVGGAIDVDLKFSQLPLVGDIPVFNEYALKHIGFSYTNADPKKLGKPVEFHIPQVDTSDNPLYTRSDTTAKNKSDYTISTQGDKTKFSLGDGGFSLTAGLMKTGSAKPESNFALPMALPSTTPSEAPAPYYKNPDSKVQTSPPGSPIHWVNVNKTFGPLTVNKIGVNYEKGEATFGISAGLLMGGFTLDVQGLSITFPLPLPGMPAGNEVSFDIDGLAMDFTEPGLKIGGAFLKSVDDKATPPLTNYFGEVIVQVAEFGFKAIGGYAPAQHCNPAAFFVYANLEVPLGGPPFLYVTGLAFGFGVNYALILPTIETLPTYALLPNMAPPAPASAKDALTGVISKLENGSVIKYEAGEYWVGFGIQFTSFDMVSAFAMLTVSFGVETQIALLGSCAIVLPEGDPEPLASLQVNLVAAITPSTGLFNVEGVITPASYVFGPFVKLSGGFAFYLWFAKENKGDFVVSVGGYHPAFVKPPQYPAVPRIRVTFNLGPFQASGSAYLALTPSMFMAGIHVAATFDAVVVKVWFNMGADFLIGWAPFQYQADAYVNIGCSIDLGLFTVSIHVGADLQLWGPPFGGKADVDLDIVKITIEFGSKAAEPAPITWENLEQNFLPSTKEKAPPPKPLMAKSASFKAEASTGSKPLPTANVSASVSVGLIGKDALSEDGETWDWIIDPDHFLIVTSTTVPANFANWTMGESKSEAIPNDPTQYGLSDVDVSEHPYYQLLPDTKPYSATQVWNPNIHVKPMKLSAVQSVHTIELRKRTDDDHMGDFSDYLSTVSIEPVLSNSNTALWGDPNTPTENDANLPILLPATLLGFTIIPLPRDADTVSNVPLIDLLFTVGEQTTFNYTAMAKTAYKLKVVGGGNDPTFNITVSGPASEQVDNSNYILSSLNDTWVAGQRNAILNDLVANGLGTYDAAEVTLTDMTTTEALTDWPMAAVLGHNNFA